MGEGKQSSSAISILNPSSELRFLSCSLSPPQNPLLQIVKELGTGFECWVSKKPPDFEAVVSNALRVVVSTALGAAEGAVVGFLLANLSQCLFSVPPLRPGLDPNSVSSYMSYSLGGPPLVRARKFAVLGGVTSGFETVLRRLNRQKDMQCRLIAGFGSGVIISFLNGMGGSNQPANMAKTGLTFLLAQGVTCQLLRKIHENNKRPWRREDTPC